MATKTLLITLAPYHRNDWHNMTEMAGTTATELSTKHSVNRTKVELKYFLEQVNQSRINPVNRTKVELKLPCAAAELDCVPAVNRTKVELKCNASESLQPGAALLIAPRWN